MVRLEDDENLNGAPRLVIPRIAPGRVEPPKRPQKTPRKGYTPPKPKPAKPVVSLAAPLTAAEAVKHAHSKLRVTYDVNWSTSQKRAMILEVLEINRVRRGFAVRCRPRNPCIRFVSRAGTSAVPCTLHKLLRMTFRALFLCCEERASSE